MNENIIDPVLSIPSFYYGSSIFITGVTGFLGKVLMEKILRSCTGIQEIFLLIRSKNNASIDERLQKLLTNSLFDKLWNEQPQCFEKLIPVNGDITLKELGLSTVDRDMLIEKVSMVFHAAAIVKFDDTLRNMLLSNVRGTREICILCKNMKNLKALVYVGTSYSQVDKPIIEDVIYPLDVDWRKTIQIAENVNEHVLEAFASKYIGTMPNYYTFSKRLAEQVITDHSGSIPCTISRPSIITSTLREPIIGWTSSFNGPVPFLIAASKGLLKIMHSDFSICGHIIPVDTVAKMIIVIAWKRGITRDNNNFVPLVYNCCTNLDANFSQQTLMQLGMSIIKYDIPLENMISMPGIIATKNYFLYNILVILLHIIPSLFLDTLLRVAGRRPKLLKLQRKIYTINNVYKYFLFNQWDIRNVKISSLLNDIPSQDQEAFGYIHDLNFDFNTSTYFRNSIIGGKVYLLHESMDRVNEARSYYKRIMWISTIIKTILIVFLMWIIYKLI